MEIEKAREDTHCYDSDMAVPYETMSDEARRRQCQNRLCMREVRPQDTQEGRLYNESAKAIASM
jgi:hypothetical protein